MTLGEAAAIEGRIAAAQRQATAQFRAGMVVHAATLRILVDAGVTTREAACAEIEAIRAAFPEVFSGDTVAEATAWAIELLHGRTPLHGSTIEKIVQQRDREANRVFRCR